MNTTDNDFELNEVAQVIEDLTEGLTLNDGLIQNIMDMYGMSESAQGLLGLLIEQHSALCHRLEEEHQKFDDLLPVGELVIFFTD